MSIPEELSDREQQVLTFIHARKTQTGHTPSYREIAAHLGVKSTGLVKYYLDALEGAGRIRREFAQARSITVIDPPFEDYSI